MIEIATYPETVACNLAHPKWGPKCLKWPKSRGIYTALLAQQISLQNEIFALPCFGCLHMYYPREIGGMGELFTYYLLDRILASSPSLQPSKPTSLSGEALIPCQKSRGGRLAQAAASNKHNTHKEKLTRTHKERWKPKRFLAGFFFFLLTLYNIHKV